jgi:transcriptional regulator with XRE-family HTH domain
MIRMTSRSPTEEDRAVGQRVRLARKISKMSQQKLAAEIGVTYQQVQKYENGTDRIGAGRLFQVALSTDHPIEFFFNFDGTATDAESKRADRLSDVAIQKLIAAASAIKSKALLANLSQVADSFASSAEAGDLTL